MQRRNQAKRTGPNGTIHPGHGTLKENLGLKIPLPYRITAIYLAVGMSSKKQGEHQNDVKSPPTEFVVQRGCCMASEAKAGHQHLTLLILPPSIGTRLETVECLLSFSKGGHG